MQSNKLTDQYAASVDAVRSFFARFYGDTVDAVDDFDEDAVLFHVGEQRKTVVVTTDFLDFDADEIPLKLAGWNVAHLSRTLERQCRLKITGDGPEEERD